MLIIPTNRELTFSIQTGVHSVTWEFSTCNKCLDVPEGHNSKMKVGKCSSSIQLYLGHGIIITPMKNLTKYVSMLVRQAPIESRFQSKINDNLNAEIARGAVATIQEAAEWLTYTYFFIRARLNPMVYGIDYKEARSDPTLSGYLENLCSRAAQKLDSNQMIRFDMSKCSQPITFHPCLVNQISNRCTF